MGVWSKEAAFFSELEEEERKKVPNYIEKGRNYVLFAVKGKKYLLAHSGPEIEGFEG